MHYGIHTGRNGICELLEEEPIASVLYCGRQENLGDYATEGLPDSDGPYIVWSGL